MKITTKQRNALISIFASLDRKFENLNKLREIKTVINIVTGNIKSWSENNLDPTKEELKAEYEKILASVEEWKKSYADIELPTYAEIEKIITPYDETPQQEHKEPEVKEPIDFTKQTKTKKSK